MGFLASFGQGYALVSAIIATILGIVLVFIGIYILWNNDRLRKLTRPGQPTTQTNDVTGWVLIVFGILVIIASWVWYYIVSKSPTIATVEGVLGGYEILKDIF